MPLKTMANFPSPPAPLPMGEGSNTNVDNGSKAAFTTRGGLERRALDFGRLEAAEPHRAAR